MASRVSQSPSGPWAGSASRSAYWESAFGSSAAAARMGSSFSVSEAAAPSSPSIVLEVNSAPAGLGAAASAPVAAIAGGPSQSRSGRSSAKMSAGSLGMRQGIRSRGRLMIAAILIAGRDRGRCARPSAGRLR